MSTSSDTTLGEIDRPIGDRIRVVLGADGGRWLLLVDNDSGDRQWQSFHSNGILESVRDDATICTWEGHRCFGVDVHGKAYVVHGFVDGRNRFFRSLDFEQSRSLYDFAGNSSDVQVAVGTKEGRGSLCVVHGRNDNVVHNVHHGLKATLSDINENDGVIGIVRLFNEGSYFVSYEGGAQWEGLPEGCVSALESASERPNEVAVGEDGSWLLVFADHYEASTNVDRSL